MRESVRLEKEDAMIAELEYLKYVDQAIHDDDWLVIYPEKIDL